MNQARARSGKCTLGAAIAGLITPSDGSLRDQGQALGAISRTRSAEQRRRIQIVFQDPLSSLNPRQTVRTAIARPIELFFGVGAAEARRRADALLASWAWVPSTATAIRASCRAGSSSAWPSRAPSRPSPT